MSDDAGDVRGAATRGSSGSRLGYVPALDGIRALAVGSVVAFHAGLGFAVGGGVGVTVFFVLSGFLITTLLLQEFGSDGAIGLRSFYVRRVRRLVPALVFLIAGTYLIAAIGPSSLGSEFDVSELVTPSLIAGTYLTDIAVGWTSTDVGPFLHTWSLSVEEHFYLLWPVVLGVALRRGVSTRRILIGLGAVIVAVTVWRAVAFHADIRSASHAAYAFDAQADQLLIGCVLAFIMPRVRSVGEAHARAFGAMAVAGLAVLGVITMWGPSIDEHVNGAFTLAAVAAALPIAYVVALPRTALGSVLAWGPLVYLGRLSYAIYLWHFVVFHALTADVLGTSKPVSIAIRLLVTLAMSALSYHVVERRFVRRRGIPAPAARDDREHPDAPLTPAEVRSAG